MVKKGKRWELKQSLAEKKSFPLDNKRTPEWANQYLKDTLLAGQAEVNRSSEIDSKRKNCKERSKEEVTVNCQGRNPMFILFYYGSFTIASSNFFLLFE